MSAWLRRTLLGYQRTVRQTLAWIRDTATDRFGSALAAVGQEHTFSVGPFIDGQPWQQRSPTAR